VQARSKVHKKIKRFFHQFKKGENFQQARKMMYLAANKDSMKKTFETFAAPELLNTDGSIDDRDSNAKVSHFDNRFAFG
jgi:hypothetical protein